MSRRRQPTIYPPSAGELKDPADVLARGLLYDAPERAIQMPWALHPRLH